MLLYKRVAFRSVSSAINTVHELVYSNETGVRSFDINTSKYIFILSTFTRECGSRSWVNVRIKLRVRVHELHVYARAIML